MHETPLIALIAAGLGLAFILGAIATRLRISPLVGYLLAGILVGPYTPGFVGDQAIAAELAELGVILLMFGVGLHFSLKDLLSVRAIAIPGALVQILAATAMGTVIALLMGWTVGGGLVFGLALSVASTVVLLRALQEKHLIETERGRIAVGWLIVEDIAMVLTLVLLPALASLVGGQEDAVAAEPLAAHLGLGLAGILGVTVAKVAVFAALMLLIGRRLIPWILHITVYTGSRELFRLAVLAIAVGVAFGAAKLFGVSFALGAFFAGMILSESELSHQAAQETLPLRDAFSVLFFVAVGMLFNPLSLIEDPLPIIATLFIILIGKSAAAFFIVIVFRHPVATALTISASLAQIGEFSFILAELGVKLGILPQQGRDLILAGALLSILLNPVTFVVMDRLRPYLERSRFVPKEDTAAVVPPVDDAGPARKLEPDQEAPAMTALTDHVVLVGYGRVGSIVGPAVVASGHPLLVIETADRALATLREAGVETIAGNAVRTDILAAANLPRASKFIVSIPNAFEAGQIVEQAKTLNPNLEIIARAHSDVEVDHLLALGVQTVIMGEREIARAMVARIAGRDADLRDGTAPPADSGAASVSP